MKNKMKIFVTFLIAFVLALCVCGCGAKVDSGQGVETGKGEQLHKDSETINPSLENDVEDEREPEDQGEGWMIGCGYPIPDVYAMYKQYGDASLAICKLISVDDDIYQDTFHLLHDYYCLIVEFEVVEAFYGFLESGKIMKAFFYLNGDDDISDALALKIWLEETDHFLAAIGRDDSFYEYTDCSTGEIITGQCIDGEWNFENFNIMTNNFIPFRQNKVDLQYLYAFAKELEVAYMPYEEYIDFEKFIAQGMTIEEVSENLKELVKIIEEKNK